MADTYHFKSHKTFIQDVLSKPEESPTRLYSTLFTDAVLPVATGKGVKVCVLDSGTVEHKSAKVSSTIANLGRSKHSRDISGHAHAVAGIIGACDLQYMIGLAPDSIVSCAKITDDVGLATSNSIASGLLWAVITGADIIVVSNEIDFDEHVIKISAEKAIDCHAIIVCEQVKGAMPSACFDVAEFKLKNAKLMSLYTDNRYATVMSADFGAAVLAGLTAMVMEKGHAMREGKKRGEVVKANMLSLLGSRRN